LGICDPSSTANDFYYGIAVHHERGEIWVCNVLRNRIDVLDFDGNCLRTMSSGFSRPYGIAIHPNGDKVVFSHNTFAMAEYTISTEQWRPILFSYYDEVLEANVVYLDGISRWMTKRLRCCIGLRSSIITATSRWRCGRQWSRWRRTWDTRAGSSRGSCPLKSTPTPNATPATATSSPARRSTAPCSAKDAPPKPCRTSRASSGWSAATARRRW